MSGKLIGLVMRGVHGVSANAKRVLIVLAEHCPRESSTAYPGANRIADFLGIGARVARGGLAELERVGWIQKNPKTGHGPGNPAAYWIDFEAMREPAAEYDRTRAKVAGKVANNGQDKAADVRRIWTEEKRQKLHGNAADSAANAADVRRAMGGTSAKEPEVTVFQPGLNPAHAHASGNPNTGQNPFKKFSEINTGIPNPQPKPNGKAIPDRHPETRSSRNKANPAKSTTRREETEAQRIERLEIEKRRQVAMAAAGLPRGTTQ